MTLLADFKKSQQNKKDQKEAKAKAKKAECDKSPTKDDSISATGGDEPVLEEKDGAEEDVL